MIDTADIRAGDVVILNNGVKLFTTFVEYEPLQDKITLNGSWNTDNKDNIVPKQELVYCCDGTNYYHGWKTDQFDIAQVQKVKEK